MNRLIATGVELPYENRAVLSHLEISPSWVVRVWRNRLLAMAGVVFWGYSCFISNAALAQAVRVYSFPCIRDQLPPPNVSPRESGLVPAEEVRIDAARDERESVVVAIYGNQQIDEVMLVVTDLADGRRLIDSSAADVRHLKWWYQVEGNDDLSRAPDRDKDSLPRQYIPELLVKDDAVVRVDHDLQDNIVREPDAVRDADSLLPTRLPAGRMKQFWVTVHVPPDIPAGEYKGEIRVEADGRLLASVPLVLGVWPFDLSEPFLEYTLYYQSRYGGERTSDLAAREPSAVRYRAELEDIKAHGINNPPFFDTHENFEAVMGIRRELGMDNRRIYWFAQSARFARDEQGKLREGMRKQVEYFWEHGVCELVMYGWDEPPVRHLPAAREMYEAANELGAKVAAAICGHSAEVENAAIVAPALDIAIVARGDEGRNKESIALFHELGQEVWMYGGPQTPYELPDVFRRNYGLVLWAFNYDGAAPYIYQHAFGHPYIDWDGRRRDHMFTYPTINGVIPTVQWEGFREAIDDVRYLSTLYVILGKVSGQHGNHEVVRSTHEWLNALREDLHYKDTHGLDEHPIDLDTVRAEMVKRILALKRL